MTPPGIGLVSISLSMGSPPWPTKDVEEWQDPDHYVFPCLDRRERRSDHEADRNDILVRRLC